MPSRTGILGRFGLQTRHAPAASPVVAEINPESSLTKMIDASTVLAENAKLKAELKKVRQRCEEFKHQSELNQDIMQECVTASKKDVDHLSTENEKLKKRYEHLLTTSEADKDALRQQLASATATAHALTAANKDLKIRCEELTTQSQVDKDMLHITSTELASKTSEVKSLQSSLEHFSSRKSSDVASKDAEIFAHKQTISELQTSLTDLEDKYMRLTAMGCVSPSSFIDIDLTRRIEMLECDNSVLQEKLDERIADTKARMLDYADELNDLSDQLRIAETDAASYSSQLKMRDSQFKTLKAEYDVVVSELDTSRRTSRQFTSQLLSHSHAPDRDSVEGLLAAQLASAHAAAIEREGLVDKFKEQHEVLARAVRREQGEKEELVKRVEEAYAENKEDRKKFEEVLRRRDGRIGELEKIVKRKEKRGERVDSVVDRSRGRKGGG
ncbi:hypothetical protein IQ06DRAFT_349833 [Phaeosphaeriaceae sp. SRC1lsM3a]|nr:hypothetical protein IQ06DRAFT_349833 [Stagonospora sp. SRC1lsM3a]